MQDNHPKVTRAADGKHWLQIDPANPLSSAMSEVEVVPEVRRWQAAPAFSRHRYVAKPVQKKIGLVRALWIMLRSRRTLRDDKAERLRDIEELILGGHLAAAEAQFSRFGADYPDQTALVLGLISLSLYDAGHEALALDFHRLALVHGTAHPAMVEIFGSEPGE